MVFSLVEIAAAMVRLFSLGYLSPTWRADVLFSNWLDAY
jgi:hypothetical protein